MASYRLLSYEKKGQSCPGLLVSGSVFDMQLEMGLHAPSLTPYNSVDAFTNTFLKPGDHIRMEVEGLGVLENMVTERNC